MMCVGLCDTGDQMEFVKNEIIHFLKTKLLTDEGFKIPGFTIPPKDVPLEEMSVPTPALTALVWRGNNIVMKDADRDKWKLHDTFQAQFDELDSAMQQANMQCTIGQIGTNVKHERDGDGEPPLKKMRGDGDGVPAQNEPLRFIDAAAIEIEILQDVTLFQQWPCGKAKPSLSQLVLKICANHALYLVNTAAADSDKDGVATITHGSMLVGYNKGKWQHNCSGDTKEIRYTLQNSSDSVIFNGHLTSLGTLVSAKRLTAEADVARCCYHELVEDPKDDDKSAFYLRSTQEIFYVVTDVPVKREGANTAASATQAHAGSLIPPEQWNTDFTKLHWIVKWQSKKGLQPVRPQITWTGPDTAIPASKALQLTP